MVNNNPNTEPDLLWDTMKCNLRGATISYSSYKNKKCREKIEEIKKNLALKTLERDQQDSKDNAYFLQETIKQLKIQHNEIHYEKIKAAQATSQPLYYEHFEKSHKIFFHRGTSHQKDNINHISDDSGHKIMHQNKIEQEFTKFYSNIYMSKGITSSGIIHKEFFPNTDEEFLTWQDKNMLSAPITEEELKTALFSMHDGRAPGLDGFSVKFFKFFWLDLEKYLFESIICSLNKGEINISQRCGVITLIPKYDKPKDKVANW